MKNPLRLLTLLPALSALALADAPGPGKTEVSGDMLFRVRHEIQKVAFVGLATEPISSVLSDQLGLPAGEGLAVVEVVPDGPAKDLLKRHDVLVKLDDQRLIDTHQLSVLVRAHQPGDEVTLTYLRGGKSATATVKLGTHETPAISFSLPHLEVHHLRELAGGDDDGPVGSLEEMGPPPPQDGPGGEGPHIRIEKRVMRRDDGDPAMEDALHAVKWDVSNGNLVFSDESGTLNLDIKDGKKTLLAKNAKGAVLFNGPVDTHEQVEAMAPELRARFKKLQESLHGGRLDHPGQLPGLLPPPKPEGPRGPAPAVD